MKRFLSLLLLFAAPLSAQSVKSITLSLDSVSVLVGSSTIATAKEWAANGARIYNKPGTFSSTDTSMVRIVATSATTATVMAKRSGTVSIVFRVNGLAASTVFAIVAGLPPKPDTIPPPPVDTVKPPAPTAGDAELPRVYLTTSVASTPSTGRILNVASGGNLQAALDSARFGDRIQLAACATYNGNFTYGPKASGNAGEWIYVQSAGQMPTEGTRMSPAIASAFATCAPKLVAVNNNNTLASAPSATRWRFIGIEVTVATSVPQNNGTVLVGDASAEQNTIAKVPTDIIFDRVYIHGHATLDMRKCIALNSARSAIIDSYVSDCHSAFDAQAITMTNGPGPFKIVNNYLEGSAETLMFGGADPGIPNLIPSDIEVRRNHITRLMEWRGKWLQKELVESKNSSHVLFEGNVLENTWPDGQYGWVLGLWSVNQQGGCPWCVTEHWTVRNNLARHVTSGFSITGKYSTPSALAHHVTITNNVLIGVDAPDITGYGRLFQIWNVPNLRIEHNTAFTPWSPSFSYDAALMPNHIVRNNLTGGGTYQINSGYGQGLVAWQGVAGPGSDFSGNVVALFDRTEIPNNFYPATLDAIGLVGGATAAYSVTSTLDQMALSAASLYKGKATTGKDPGADIAVVKAAIAGVVQP